MSKFAKPAHKSVARMIGYTLTAATADCWAKFSLVIAARLTASERVSLAFAVLKSLSYDDARATAQAALGGDGMPGAALFGEVTR